MTADEYEAAFEGLELPESVELVPGSIVPDVKLFVELEINLLRQLKNQRHLHVIRVRLDRLLEIIGHK